MEISVIVCTRDRPEGLNRLLDSACMLNVPHGLAWELVVVDNGGGETREIASRLAGRLPIRVAAEPRTGLSLARNRGIAEARGRLLCWTDDDVTLDREWLAAWANAMRSHPDAALFGGTIVPRPEQPSPRWFANCLDDWPLAAVTASRRPKSDGAIAVDDLPWGANFALRASALHDLRFDPELGLGPMQRIGEETALFQRLLRSGAKGRWVPASIVFHEIGRDRQTLAHLGNYFRRAGATAAFLHARAPDDNANAVRGRWNPAAAPRTLLRCLAAATAPLTMLVHVPGLERHGIRAQARRNLYLGILGHRRSADTGPSAILRAAGEAR